MGIDIDFILGMGKVLSLLMVIVFIEGVVSGRPDGKWPGFLFASLIAVISVAVGLISHSFQYFMFMMVPTALCFFVYYVSRRNVARGGGFHPEEEEEEPIRR